MINSSCVNYVYIIGKTCDVAAKENQEPLEIPIEVCHTDHPAYNVPVEVCTNEKPALEGNNNHLVCGKSETMECDGLGEEEYGIYEEEEEAIADDFDAELFDPYVTIVLF